MFCPHPSCEFCFSDGFRNDEITGTIVSFNLTLHIILNDRSLVIRGLSDIQESCKIHTGKLTEDNPVTWKLICRQDSALVRDDWGHFQRNGFTFSYQTSLHEGRSRPFSLLIWGFFSVQVAHGHIRWTWRWTQARFSVSHMKDIFSPISVTL